MVVSLEDVARKARVSAATVSRALNNAGLVKPATRARVLEAAQKLNYHPNLHARTLAGGKNRTLGMVASNLENPFFLDIFRALEARAQRADYQVLVANTDYRPQRLVASVHRLLGLCPAGLAVFASEIEPSLVAELEQSGVPAVLYDGGLTGPTIAGMRIEYVNSMRSMVEYLYGLGHRRMAFIGHHAGLSPLGNRRKSFLETVSDVCAGVEFTTLADVDAPAGGRRAAARLLASRFNPTAILCVNDFMALGVLRELQARGVRVPDDISLTGFDDIGLAEYTSPALTTLHIPREEIGDTVFRTLVPSGSQGLAFGQELVIHPRLVLRESTGPRP
ncbi:MAG TPA: LacI family DNA-binding transcriptional regulator [Bryobacteraceae bacterium]|nr:LacI family DNA-binding transcriptional regulator [Bryobacteraceae bacterium]